MYDSIAGLVSGGIYIHTLGTQEEESTLFTLINTNAYYTSEIYEPYQCIFGMLWHSALRVNCVYITTCNKSGVAWFYVS